MSHTYARRYHRKTRTGCIPCKERHAKCDELKPQCSGCLRHQTQCVYPDPNTTSRIHRTAEREHRGEKRAYSPGAETAASENTLTPIRSTQSGDAGSSGRQSDEIRRLDTTDLKTLRLLHHFSTSTCFTLAHQASQVPVWQTTLPHLALEWPFLMHGILSIAALHLAYLQPAEASSHSWTAARNQDLALPMFREAMDNINESNGIAIFSYSALLTVTTLASYSCMPLSRGSFMPRLPSVSPLFHAGSRLTEPILEWMRLLRGLAPIIEQVGDAVRKSDLSPLLDDYRSQMDREMFFCPLDNRLEALSDLFAPPRVKAEHIPAYRGALHELRRIFAAAALPDLAVHLRTVAFAWPVVIPQQFFNLLVERRPEAVVLVAHYAVFLLKVDTSWFIQGTAARFVHECKRSLEEDGATWALPWIEWPMEMLNLQRVRPRQPSSSGEAV